MTKEESINNVSELIDVVREIAGELNDEFTTTSETLESPNRKENGDPIYGEHKISSEGNTLDYTMKLYVSTQMGDPVIIIREPAGKKYDDVVQFHIQGEKWEGIEKVLLFAHELCAKHDNPKEMVSLSAIGDALVENNLYNYGVGVVIQDPEILSAVIHRLIKEKESLVVKDVEHYRLSVAAVGKRSAFAHFFFDEEHCNLTMKVEYGNSLIKSSFISPDDVKLIVNYLELIAQGMD